MSGNDKSEQWIKRDIADYFSINDYSPAEMTEDEDEEIIEVDPEFEVYGSLSGSVKKISYYFPTNNEEEIESISITIIYELLLPDTVKRIEYRTIPDFYQYSCLGNTFLFKKHYVNKLQFEIDILVEDLIYIKNINNLSHEFIDHFYSEVKSHALPEVRRLYLGIGDEEKFIENCIEFSDTRDTISRLLFARRTNADVPEMYLKHAFKLYMDYDLMLILNELYGAENETRNEIILLVISEYISEKNYLSALKFIRNEDGKYFRDIRARIVESALGIGMGTLRGGSLEEIVLNLRPL